MYFFVTGEREKRFRSKKLYHVSLMRLPNPTSPRHRRCNYGASSGADVGSSISPLDLGYLPFEVLMWCRYVHLVTSGDALALHASVFAIWHDGFWTTPEMIEIVISFKKKRYKYKPEYVREQWIVSHSSKRAHTQKKQHVKQKCTSRCHKQRTLHCKTIKMELSCLFFYSYLIFWFAWRLANN